MSLHPRNRGTKTPTTEKDVINPLYPYALSKYLGEKICFHWHKLYKLPVNSIRIFNAYGPRVKTTGVYGAVFGVFFKQKLEKKIKRTGTVAKI